MRATPQSRQISRHTSATSSWRHHDVRGAGDSAGCLFHFAPLWQTRPHSRANAYINQSGTANSIQRRRRSCQRSSITRRYFHPIRRANASHFADRDTPNSNSNTVNEEENIHYYIIIRLKILSTNCLNENKRVYCCWQQLAYSRKTEWQHAMLEMRHYHKARKWAFFLHSVALLITKNRLEFDALNLWDFEEKFDACLTLGWQCQWPCADADLPTTPTQQTTDFFLKSISLDWLPLY